MLSQLGWFALQTAVVLATVWWISTWADIAQFGLAPWAVGLFAAFVVTGLVALLIDRLRFPRRLRSSEQPDGSVLSLPGTDRHASDSPKSIGRGRIGKDGG
jgi:hypothetical protein